MYADERELLVFRTFSQSVSVPKRVFRHAETMGHSPIVGLSKTHLAESFGGKESVKGNRHTEPQRGVSERNRRESGGS